MKREETNLRELVEPDQDAGSSARVQRREPWITEPDPESSLAFGDLLDIHANYTHVTRKGRHMQRRQNIPMEDREKIPVCFRPSPGKRTRREKQKEKRKDRGKKRDYYEYRDRHDEDGFTWRDQEDVCSQGCDRDECNQGKDRDACSRGYAEYAYMKEKDRDECRKGYDEYTCMQEKDRDECSRVYESDRETRARGGAGTPGCPRGTDACTQKNGGDRQDKKCSRDRTPQEVPA